MNFFDSLSWFLFFWNIKYITSNLIDIIGGKPVTEAEDFSYQVSIHVIDGQVFCGGVIIDENHILTAAHCICVKDYFLCPVPAQAIYVVAGSKTLIASPSSSSISRVKAIFVHNNYIEYTLADDIAILRLEQPLLFSHRIKRIQLVDYTPEDGTECLASGFGVTTEHGNPSNDLLQTKTSIIGHNECSRYYRLYFTHICARGHDAELCYGDSGGPLQCNGKLAGIASYSACGRGTFPTGYTNVAMYKDWIDEQLQRTTSNSVQFNFYRTAVSYISSVIYTIRRAIFRIISDIRTNIFGVIRFIFPVFF